MQPSEFQKKVWYRTLTAICIAALGGIFVGGIWISGQILAYLQPVLVPLAVAGILAYLIEPIVTWSERKGLSRMKAILAVFAASIIFIGGFSAMIAVPLSNQVKRLNENMGDYMSGAKKMIGEFGDFDEFFPESIRNKFFKGKETEESEGEAAVLEGGEELEIVNSEEEIAEPSIVSEVSEVREFMNADGVIVEPESAVDPVKAEIVEAEVVEAEEGVKQPINFDVILKGLKDRGPELAQRVLSAVTRGASKFFGIVGYALGFILVPIYLFYFLNSVMTEINAYLIAFFRGQVLVSVIDGFLVGLVLKMFGHPYAILLGVALAVLGVIPFIGNLICLVPAAITAYTHFSIESNQYWVGENPWIYVVLIISIFIVVQQINSLVTAPKIVGESVGLHPMTVIFSMLFWSLLLGGFLGALLAVPLTASVKVFFRRYIWEKRVLGDEDLNDEGEVTDEPEQKVVEAV